MAFLERKKTSNKCSKCLIQKKCVISHKEENVIIEKKGTGDILFVLEMPEREIFYSKFKYWINKHGITNYQIAVGLKCRTSNFEIPTPMYSTFKTCNCITENIDCKVIIPIGRAIMAITKSDDITSWRDFAEYNFNQTYFYTPFQWKTKKRVYPIPALIDWVKDKTNFESFYALRQITEIKKYLQNPIDNIDTSYEYEYVENPNEFLRVHNDKELVSWDLETKHLDHFSDDFFIICLTISFDGKKGYYLPYEKINKRVLTNFFKGKKGILANGKFDTKALWLDSVKTPTIYDDVVLYHHLLSTQRITNSIKTLSWLIGFGGYQKDLDEYVSKYKIKFYSNIPKDILIPYSCLDPIVAFKLKVFGDKLGKLQPKVVDCYRNYVIPSLPVFQRMEVEGMHINQGYLNDLNSSLSIRIKKLEKEIQEFFGQSFEVSSNQKLARILEDQQWACYGRSEKQYYIKKGRSGKELKIYYYSVGDPQLIDWEKDGHKIATKIREYRTLVKLKGTFVGEIQEEESNKFFDKKQDEKVEGLVKYIKSDNRIHPSYNPGRTDSIRSSASYPNAQQFPKQEAEGKLFRPVIGCPDDWYILEVDYSGFQLRIAAILSGDPTMKDIFINKGGDIHSVTAQAVFCRDITVEEFLLKKKEPRFKNYRQKAKAINFGFLFGMIAVSFKRTLYEEWSEKEIDEYIDLYSLTMLETKDGPDKYFTVASDMRDKFFGSYTYLLPWIESQHNFGEKNGFVESWHGGRRHLPQLTHKGYDYNTKVMSNLLNITVNSPVQTFEACEAYKGGIKIYNKIQERGMQCYPFTMVHDSYAFYVPKNEVKDLYHICKECMEDTTTWDIPILVDVAVGKIWGFGDEIESEKDLEKFI